MLAASIAARASAADDSANNLQASLYSCVRASGSEPIALSARVDALCRRHPEMSPCKHERENCRKSGGRVFLASGEEITAATEAAYDKRVQRFTLGGDGASRPPSR